jgi:TPP-dependent pyruvate/acetoin dehydrogenase alpha subunit
MNIPVEKKIRMHKSLVRIRRAEEILADSYKQQEMRTPTHFGIGQEAVAVGVCEALRPDDVIYSHHRCHAHYLAKGGDLGGLVSELYGRESGCSRGRGGSVHLNDQRAGVVATSAVLGQTIGVAVGSALAFAMDGESRVAVSFFGEAACEEGIFYESLNFAAIRRLPVLFVCENNLYSTESPLSVRQPSGTSLCERVRSFKIRAEEVDGNDVLSMYLAAEKAVSECRRGAGPVFLECFTYRWREHVGPFFDYELKRTYRSREELEQWMAKCPVVRSAAHLTQTGLATQEEMAAWLRQAEDEIQHAVEEAKKSPWPDPSTLLDGVH